LFLVESKWPTQRLVSSNKFKIRYIMLTYKHAKWAIPFFSKYLTLNLYVVEEDVMEDILGYILHRGCMTLAERNPLPSPVELFNTFRPSISSLSTSSSAPSSEIADGTSLLMTSLSSLLLPSSSSAPSFSFSPSDLRPKDQEKPILVIVAERVASPENIGVMFRSALALGASAAFLSPGCSDPLYRKAIRSSMGAVTKLPFCWLDPFLEGLDWLKAMGFVLLALTPANNAIGLSDIQYPSKRIALIVGHEGSGLTKETIQKADLCVKVEMAANSVDSLNVSACTSISLYTVAHALGII